MRTRAWQGYLVVGTAIAAAYFALPSARIVLWAALGVSAAAATVVGVRWHRPSTSLAWWLLAAGELTFVAGDVVNDLLRRGGGEVLFPSLADLAYLATYPLLVAGLLLLIRRRSAGRDLASMLDAVAITTAARMLSWLFLITPTSATRSSPCCSGSPRSATRSGTCCWSPWWPDWRSVAAPAGRRSGW
jgi:hypothetical protein